MGKKYIFFEHFQNEKNETKTRNIYEMPEEEFAKIAPANKKVFEVYRFEELFAILIDNFLEFNKTILAYADKARLQMFYIGDYFQKRIDVNRSALNFLSTLNMYHDFIKEYIKDESIANLFNTDKDIQRCLVMRHYIQHVESFPINTTLSYVNGDTDVMLTSVRFAITSSRLKIEKLEKPNRNKYHRFFNADEELDLYEIINQGMAAIQCLQSEIRKTVLYTEEYRQQKDFLLAVKQKITPANVTYTNNHVYHEKGKNDIKDCFLATSVIEFIENNILRYTCEHSFANQFITTAPYKFVKKCSDKIFSPAVNQQLREEAREQLKDNPNA